MTTAMGTLGRFRVSSPRLWAFFELTRWFPGPSGQPAVVIDNGTGWVRAVRAREGVLFFALLLPSVLHLSFPSQVVLLRKLPAVGVLLDRNQSTSHGVCRSLHRTPSSSSAHSSIPHFTPAPDMHETPILVLVNARY